VSDRLSEHDLTSPGGSGRSVPPEPLCVVSVERPLFEYTDPNGHSSVACQFSGSKAISVGRFGSFGAAKVTLVARAEPYNMETKTIHNGHRRDCNCGERRIRADVRNATSFAGKSEEYTPNDR
jgi:hypothetical protein